VNLNLRRLSERWAARVQQAYAQVIQSASSPKRGGAGGGTLSARVLDRSLVQFRRWGFVFQPSRLGASFRFWWNGTKRQAGRGKPVPIDEAQLARELEEELARQVRQADRR
tara:strand:- start:1601 stop:1933 length:333 start_codon:yes stop_codon:yes gene_type:complete